MGKSPSALKPVRIAAALASALALSGCIAIPVAMTSYFSIGSLAIDGLSMFASGKSLSDHALSMLTQRDCVVMRALMSEPICSSYVLSEVDEAERQITTVNEDGPGLLLSAEDKRLKELSEAWLNAGQEGAPETRIDATPVAALATEPPSTPPAPASAHTVATSNPVAEQIYGQPYGQPYEMRIIGVMIAHPPAAN